MTPPTFAACSGRCDGRAGYEMLRLGARELGWGTTEEVARELSAFADACLEAAVSVCDAELSRELGPPRTEAGAQVRFVVMAMGKLGGEELNFSSDVDVCYFYDTDAGTAGRKADGEPRTLHEYYEELARRVSAALDEATGDGIVFRVDLRLRPEGRSGPLSNSLHAAEGYTRRSADLGAAGLAAGPTLRGGPFARRGAARHPRAVHLSAQHRRQAGRGRARPAGQFRDPADARGALGQTGFDVKLGAGGSATSRWSSRRCSS